MKIIRAIIIILLLCSNGWAGDMVLHLNMNGASGNLTDLSGYGNNCTANGNPVYAQTGAPNRGNAISFDGTGDYFNCGDPASGNLDIANNTTFMGWINSADVITQNAVMGKYQDTNNRWYFYFGSGYRLYFLAVMSGSTVVSTHTGINSLIGYTNNWFHFAFSFVRGGTSQMYLNGVLKHSPSTTDT